MLELLEEGCIGLGEGCLSITSEVFFFKAMKVVSQFDFTGDLDSAVGDLLHHAPPQLSLSSIGDIVQTIQVDQLRVAELRGHLSFLHHPSFFFVHLLELGNLN